MASPFQNVSLKSLEAFRDGRLQDISDEDIQKIQFSLTAAERAETLSEGPTPQEQALKTTPLERILEGGFNQGSLKESAKVADRALGQLLNPLGEGVTRASEAFAAPGSFRSAVIDADRTILLDLPPSSKSDAEKLEDFRNSSLLIRATDDLARFGITMAFLPTLISNTVAENTRRFGVAGGMAATIADLSGATALARQIRGEGTVQEVRDAPFTSLFGPTLQVVGAVAGVGAVGRGIGLTPAKIRNLPVARHPSAFEPPPVEIQGAPLNRRLTGNGPAVPEPRISRLAGRELAEIRALQTPVGPFIGDISGVVQRIGDALDLSTLRQMADARLAFEATEAATRSTTRSKRFLALSPEELRVPQEQLSVTELVTRRTEALGEAQQILEDPRVPRTAPQGEPTLLGGGKPVAVLTGDQAFLLKGVPSQSTLSLAHDMAGRMLNHLADAAFDPTKLGAQFAGLEDFARSLLADTVFKAEVGELVSRAERGGNSLAVHLSERGYPAGAANLIQKIAEVSEQRASVAFEIPDATIARIKADLTKVDTPKLPAQAQRDFNNAPSSAQPGTGRRMAESEGGITGPAFRQFHQEMNTTKGFMGQVLDNLTAKVVTPKLPGQGAGREIGVQRFSKLRDISPVLFEDVTQLIAVRDFARFTIVDHFNNLTEILDTPALQDTFVRLGLDRRAKGIRKLRSGQLGIEYLDPKFDASKMTLPEMTPDQLRSALNDPKIQKAMRIWQEDVMPEARQLSKEGGVPVPVMDANVAATDGFFMHAIRVTPDGFVGRGGRVVNSAGREIKIPRFSRRIENFSKRKSGFANRATGTATPTLNKATGKIEAYRTDLKGVLQGSFENDLGISARNRLFNTIETSIEDGGVRVMRPEGGTVPEFVEINGQTFPVQEVKGLDIGGRVTSGHYPKPIAEALEIMRSMKVNEPQALRIRQFSHYITGIRLAVPAEAIVHGINVLGGLSAVSDLGTSIQTRALARVGGPGRFAAAILENMTPFNEGYTRMQGILAKNGGFRTRGFGGQEGIIPAWIEKALFLDKLRDGVFDINGLEANSRILLGQAIERSQPNLSGAELALQVNEALGTYVRGLEPGVVRGIKQIGFDPFATAGLSLSKTGVRAIFGFPADKVGFNAMLAGEMWLGNLGFWAMWNKVQDHQNRWPWEAGIDPSQIIIFDDGAGNRKTLDMRLWNPIFARAMRVTGGRSLMRAAFARPGDNADQYVADAFRDVANSLIFNRAGPAVRTASVAAFGVAPHLGRDLRPFQIAPKASTTESQLMINLESALAGLNPSLELLSGELQARDRSRSLLETAVGGLTGLTLTKIPSELYTAGAPERQRRRRVRQFVESIFSTVRSERFTVEEQFELMREEIERREGDPRSRVEALQAAIGITTGVLRQRFKDAAVVAENDARAAEVLERAVQRQNEITNQRQQTGEQAPVQAPAPQANPAPPNLTTPPAQIPQQPIQGIPDELLTPQMRRKLNDVRLQ